MNEEHDNFGELLERIQALTGLDVREAATVAFQFEPDEVPSAPEIIEHAQHLGFDVEAKHERQSEDTMEPPIAEITFDPAVVLSEVYENCPRVMCSEFPKIGRAPLTQDMPEEVLRQLDELPEEIVALVVNLNVIDEQCTLWLRDEANEIDRPVGPIDLRRFKSEHALRDGIMVLLNRLPLVLRSDWN